MLLMGYREYSRHRGCSLKAVQDAIRDGRIKVSEKKIDSDVADRSWAATTNPAKRPAGAADPAPATVVMPLLDGAPQAAPESLGRRVEWPEITEPWPPPVMRQAEPERRGNVVEMDTFLAAKTERERAEAEMAKDALAERRGQLTDAAAARKVFYEAGRMYGRMRENLPTQLATKLVGLTDLGEIERIIRTAFRDADTRIADEINARFSEFLHVRSSGVAG